jgi:hypothetical protein
MALIFLGALLLVGGIVFMAVQPLRRGQLSGGQLHAARTEETLEPRRPALGFGLKANWPGLALVALGAVLMLAAGVV